MNTASGAYTETKAEWVTEPCGIPLFQEQERKTGVCRSCAKGWTHPENYRVDAEMAP